MRPVRFAFVALGLAALVLLLWSQRGSFGPADVGAEAPSYAAATLAGDTLRLDDLRGRVVLLNVWATWCIPCVEEMPALQRLHDRLEQEGLSVVAVSVDAGSPGNGDADVSSFVDRFGLTFTVLRDASGRIEDAFGVAGLPTTFVIDRNGRIHRKVLGAREWDDPTLASEIQSLLEG